MAGLFGGAVKMLLTPLQGLLCDGDGSAAAAATIDTNEKKYTCDECAGATKSTWMGTQVIRNPDGTFKEFIAGQTCILNGFSPFLCGNPNYPGFVTCADGKEMKKVQLVECLKKVKKPANLGGDVSGDKPKPLVMADDWKERVNVRAFTLLTDANMAARRQSVNVAVKADQKGGNPMLNQLLGTARRSSSPSTDQGTTICGTWIGARGWCASPSATPPMLPVEWATRRARACRRREPLRLPARSRTFCRTTARRRWPTSSCCTRRMMRNRPKRSDRGAAYAEMVLLLPVMILMWAGIDYFRSGYARRLESLGKAHAMAWKLASSNDGSCFANKEFFAGFTGESNITDASNVGEKGSEATNSFSGSTSSSMFMYAHANVGASMKTKGAYFDGGAVGQVKGGMYITCNEVVPATNSQSGIGSSGSPDKFADQNVLTPLWDFVSSIF